MNNKGQMGIIFFFIILFTILIIGFIAAIVIGLFGYAGDVVTPVFTGLGVVGDTNLSQASQDTIGIGNTFIQALPWIFGFAYVVALIGSIAFVISLESNPNPIFIGVYFMFMILLIFGSIIMSNMYQDIYTGTDVLATSLQSQTLTSYMILYSPFIMALITIIAGIYLFTRSNESLGGYGV